MSNVAVERVHEEGEARSLFEGVKDLADRVRRRAFELFEGRARENGSDLDDWLKAENELIWAPESDLVEKDGKFEVQVVVPGFDVKDVRVTALPNALVVRAESTHRHDETEGDVRFCEFGERSLFRRFELPATINVDKVAASLDKGVLKLIAEKVEKPSAKKVAIAA